MSPLRIRVATYNVHKCKGMDRRTSVERIVAVIRQLNADVIALQEIVAVEGGRPEYDQVRRITGELKEYDFCFGENRKLHGGAYGNLTLSRFPVKHCQNYDVTWHKRERRGCLRSDISLTDRAVLHVFNVHLGTGFVERRHQARRLLSSEVLNRSELISPRIVAGDFNEWVRGLASRLMGNTFAAVEPKAFLRYARTYPGVLPLLHLDHFYFDRQLILRTFRLHRSRKALIASDHLPLVAEFELAL
ncbi:MAG TPA: endonuclease/exonuclease/phosphatase family protein [Terriglobales bacterium]|nr:endonuclease/exonuclease/phosphatase family protein [Terriglobales bacterium]